jgi:hypothetical protein
MISHLLVVITFYGSLFLPVFRLVFRMISDVAFLSLAARIALSSELCSTEDQIYRRNRCSVFNIMMTGRWV